MSNRGHDSVGAYAVDETSGLLAPLVWEPTQGRQPRFITLDPCGRFLYAANETTDSIVQVEIDPQTRKLQPTAQSIKTGSPVCIVFGSYPAAG